jgi:hypothetical protein
MCILHYYPAGKLPNPDHLTNSCENNPDGFGWAVIAGELILTGQTMDATVAVETFTTLREQYPDSDALFHARIATHGRVTVDNCHPFFVNGRSDMVLAHNGIMPCQPKPGDIRSDTRILAEDLLMREFRKLDSEKTIKRLSAWVGYSKVLILSTNPRYRKSAYLINEGMGHWHYGVWYSNDSYKPDPWAKYTWSKDLLWESETGYVMGPTGRRATLDEDMRWVCLNAGCHKPSDWCQCHTPVMGILSPDDMIASAYVQAGPDHVETDDIDTWYCRNCEYIGWISLKSFRCDFCWTMYCCDMPEASCQCYSEPSGSTPMALTDRPHGEDSV